MITEENEKKTKDTIIDIHPFKNSKWNKKIEKIVIDIGNKSIKYKNLHMKIADDANKTNTVLMTTIIVISPISGTLGALGATMEQYNWAYSITSSLISFISSILVSIVKFSKYEKINTSHRTASTRYNSLENNVKRQLSLSRKDRIPANQYLDWLTTTFDDLYLSSPLLYELKDVVDIEEEMIKEDEEIEDDSDEDINVEYRNIKKHKNDNKKTDLFTEFQDLHKYDDRLMNYQLKRFNNI
jgi:hypothetical protein